MKRVHFGTRISMANRAKAAAFGATVLSLCAVAVMGFEPRNARGEPSERSNASLALPGPAPRPRKDSLLNARAINDACASCHADIAAEWQGSLHRQAWTDSVFQRAYAIEPVAFCRSCHAPEADPKSEPSQAAQAVGVGCTTCHLQGDDVVASHENKRGPHPVLADARMATAQACASCHQFDFPGEKSPMQDTVREHAASSFAKTSCQDCHMPLAGAESGGKAHRSHAFQVIGDTALLRQGAKVSASRPSGRQVVVSVAPGAAGHAFPTGDMFRRLEVRAEALDAEGKAIAKAEPVFLGRTFADKPRDRDTSFSFHRTEAADTRVPPPGAGEARVVQLSFGQPIAASRVRFQVVYQRMSTAMAASFGVSQAVDEVVIADGILPPVKAAP